VGASFVNVQARVRDRDAASKLVEAIRETARSTGYVETEGDACDREVLVGPLRDGWITVYDELAEMQDEEVIDALAQALSEATGDVAVGVLLHDSDVLMLRRFDAGRRIDVYNSAPDYFDPCADGSAEPEGSPERWADLLQQGTAGELQRAWSGTPLFAESILGELAPRFGWSDLAMTGYRYAGEDVTAGFRRLRFRLEDAAEATDLDGPPDFALSSYAIGAETIVDELHLVQLSVRNEGGASRGYEIQAWGSALERGLIEVEQIVVGTAEWREDDHEPRGLFARVGRWWQQRDLEEVEPIEGSMVHTIHGAKTPTMWVDPEDEEGEDDDERDEDFITAAFKRAPIAAGTNDIEKSHLTHRALERALAEGYRRDIQIELRVRALAPGRGVLNIAAVPRANEDDGTVSHLIAVQVAERSWAPAGAIDALQARLELGGNRNVVALVTLGVDASTAAPLVAAAFEQWHAALEAVVDDDYVVMTYPIERGAKLELPARALTNDDRWHRWAATLPHADFFTATAEGTEEQEYAWLDDEDLDEDEREDLEDSFSCTPTASHGFSFAGGGDNDAAPLVGFWFDTEGLDAPTVARLRGEVGTIVDRLMADGSGLQASLARWSWTPSSPLGGTPYESALGLGGTLPTPAEASRHLRAVAETTWLGEALWDRLESPDRLTLLADATRVGSTRRVSLKSAHTLDELELAFAGILPR